MSRKFLVSLDLNKNELLNARLQNLSSDPSSPVAGQIYYNTQDKVTKFYDGTQWVAGGSTKYGLEANRPAASKGGTLYAATDTSTLFLDNGTSWVQISVNPQDLADAISDHSDLTTGVHGVTGSVVGTTDTQDLSNKRIIDTLNFSDGANGATNVGEIEVQTAGHLFNIQANNGDLNLKTVATGASVYVISDTGDIVLATTSGTSYIDSVASANEIATKGYVDGVAGDAASDLSTHEQATTGVHGVTGNVAGTSDVQTLSNKTISDNLHFDNGTDAGYIAAGQGELRIDGNTTVGIYADTNINLATNAGDIVLNPDGVTNVNSILNVTSNLNTTTIAGADFDGRDGSLTLQDGNADSQIHINGTTKNIELLPVSGSKAFYGSAATAGNEIAKISDIQASSSGLSWKTAVNLFYNDPTPSLTGDSVTTPLIIDGHSALDIADIGYRILVGQGNDAGIYVYNQTGTTWTLDRSTDGDVYSELIGAAVFVIEGTTYGSTSWVQSNHYITNFTGQDWIQFSGQGTYIGSDSIQIDGREINVIVDGTRGLAIDGDGVHAKIGNGIEFDGSGNVAINAGTGFDISSGALNFATSYGVRKYAESIGNASATSFQIDHVFGTKDVTVQVFQNAADYGQVEVDVEHTHVDYVTIKFAAAPALNEFRVVIVG